MEGIRNTDLTVLTNALIQVYANRGHKRFLLAITGVPGAGKSTLAKRLMKKTNEVLQKEIAIVIPMDGFHYHNDRLAEQGLLSRKGSPETFDAKGFLHTIKKIALAEQETIYYPAYSRKLHNPIDRAILVKNKHKIIIVEGNYLLLDSWPWNELADLFTESWFLDISLAASQKRLIKRHIATGRSVEEAVQKVNATDMPNAELIMETRNRASKIIKVVGE